jgi:hypothetical protein
LRLLQVLAANPNVVCKIIGFPLRRRRRVKVGMNHPAAKSSEPAQKANEEAG